jgi:hypothetical protein
MMNRKYLIRTMAVFGLVSLSVALGGAGVSADDTGGLPISTTVSSSGVPVTPTVYITVNPDGTVCPVITALPPEPLDTASILPLPITSLTIIPLPPTVSPWPISYDQAIEIASRYITAETLGHCKYWAGQMGSTSSNGETRIYYNVFFTGGKMTEADLACGAAAPQPYDPNNPYDSMSIMIDGQTGEFISKSAYNYVSIEPAPPIDAVPLPAYAPDWTGSIADGSGYAEPGKAADATQTVPEPAITDIVYALDGNSQEMAAPTVPAAAPASSNLWVVLGCAGGLVLLLGGGALTLALRKNRKPGLQKFE